MTQLEAVTVRLRGAKAEVADTTNNHRATLERLAARSDLDELDREDLAEILAGLDRWNVLSRRALALATEEEAD